MVFSITQLISSLKILEEAKDTTVTEKNYGEVTFVSEDTEYPICLYPSVSLLEKIRNLEVFENQFYTKRLALGEPHLKPIFFDIEVLERYSNDPRFDFQFKDYSGKISCQYDDNDEPIVREEDQIFLKSFGLGFDAEGNRLAVVFLSDLKNLTGEHQVYWKSKERKEEGCKVLEEYHQNMIQGEWTFSYSIFSGFIGELNCLNKLSEHVFGKSVFRKSFDKESRPQEFTFFFTPTLKNYQDFVLLMDKMLSDNINKEFFEGDVDFYEMTEIEGGLVERKPKGTLRIFEEWLIKIYRMPDSELIKELFRPLKKIRRERQNPAHRISQNDYDTKYINKQKELTGAAYSSLRALRTIFEQHPKAKEFEVPKWLNEGAIKNF